MTALHGWTYVGAEAAPAWAMVGIFATTARPHYRSPPLWLLQPLDRCGGRYGRGDCVDAVGRHLSAFPAAQRTSRR
jgi:hypothetical protein